MKLGDFDTAAQYREAIRQASAEFSEELKKWKATHAEETIAVDEEQVAHPFDFLLELKRAPLLTY